MTPHYSSSTQVIGIANSSVTLEWYYAVILEIRILYLVVGSMLVVYFDRNKLLLQQVSDLSMEFCRSDKQYSLVKRKFQHNDCEISLDILTLHNVVPFISSGN